MQNYSYPISCKLLSFFPFTIPYYSFIQKLSFLFSNVIPQTSLSILQIQAQLTSLKVLCFLLHFFQYILFFHVIGLNQLLILKLQKIVWLCQYHISQSYLLFFSLPLLYLLENYFAIWKISQIRLIPDPKAVSFQLFLFFKIALAREIKIILYNLITHNKNKESMPKQSSQNSSSKKKSRRAGGGDGSTSHNTKKKLIQFIMRTAQLQRKLEIIKEMLAEEPEFTPSSLFYRLDSARKKFITEKDIQDFLVDSNIPYKGSELKILFGRMDARRVQSISQREFQNFILPNQNPRLRYETVRRPVLITRPHEKLNEKIEWITAKFFTEIMKEYAKLSEFNSSLVNSFDFDADRVFDLLSCGQDRITPETIQMFMEDNGYELTREQIGCLIKLIDKKGQAKIQRQDLKSYMATLGLKREHQIFDELSPIPALKDFSTEYIQKNLREREKTLKDRYKDNKSYVKGMDEEGHHILGYSRARDQEGSGSSPLWRSRSRGDSTH